ncbi:hypothetical protein ANN_08454 [Periplaneta americana]|uniref:Uncharacterized protein n=1 Tax=Periplaneta americana TaxID=6978 RepID=A0ABQ8T314_PERAM|nr:hypothetical protein ANN_08454 [Periplaneta americana]
MPATKPKKTEPCMYKFFSLPVSCCVEAVLLETDFPAEFEKESGSEKVNTEVVGEGEVSSISTKKAVHNVTKTNARCVRLCDIYSNQELAEIHFMYGKADGSSFVPGEVPTATMSRSEDICTSPLPSVRALSPADYPARVRFCQWFLQQCGVNPNFPALVLFTDEVQFTRDGITNFHNQHIWAYENPLATVPSHHQVRFSLNMWAGIIGDRLVGPHVLTGQAYTNFLENTIPHVLEDTSLINRQHIHFLHDGAPAHFSHTARRYLDRRFPDRWIGRGGPIAWPPRSPDLNPLDFYFGAI